MEEEKEITYSDWEITAKNKITRRNFIWLVIEKEITLGDGWKEFRSIKNRCKQLKTKN